MSELYLTPEQKIRQRHNWFQEADRLGNVRLACLRLGISRKTFYKWRRRFRETKGDRSSWLDRPRRPHHPRRRVKKGLIRRILALRERTRLGPLRLRQLLQNQGCKRVPSAFTLSKILKRAGLTRRRRARPKRYRRSFIVPRPGGVLQVDIKYVPYLVAGRQWYPYTAIDCCTRLRIVQFSEEMANHVSQAFLQYVLSTLPFPVKIVQTDNDATFTNWYTAASKTPLDRPLRNHPFTAVCEQLGATHRLIPPRTPRLNGKVERSHQTDEEEFYRLRSYETRSDLEHAFARWLWHYNHTRLHMGVGGKTPIQVLQGFSEYARIKQLQCHPC